MTIKLEFPKRKHSRLKEYDYSQNGYYFATICVKNRESLLGSINVGRDAHIPPTVELTQIGEVTDKYIQNINTVYEGVAVDKYIIMPNHIHMIIVINERNVDSGGMRASRPTLHTIIRSLKTMITKQSGNGIWQDSYYDRIIRDERGYREIWEYIDENPLKWREDELYSD